MNERENKSLTPLAPDFGRELLRRELDRRLESNPRYSLRAFARALRMSPGELSEVMNGKRPLSPRSAQRIAEALSLSPHEERQLLAQTLRPGVAAPLKAPPSLDLDEDQFRLVSDWACFAILNLLDAERVRWQAHYIAERFQLDVARASSAMARLVRLKLVEVKDGIATAFRPKGDEIVAAPQVVASAAIRRYHRDLLMKGLEAIESQAPTERELGGVGFAVAQEDLPDLKKMLQQFQDELLSFVDRRAKRRRRLGQQLEVYQLEMILFRLSQPKRGGSNGKT
jgi:transcriptional regulator with XRE-family HTH domain